MSQIQLTINELNQLAPLDIVKSDNVRAHFIRIYDVIWGGGGEAAYERESAFFTNILRDNQKLQTATKFSIFNSFIDLAVCGLSLEPGARALCYLMGRNVCVGTDPHTGKKAYEGRLVLTVSGYGELVLRTRAGQIRHADNPVLVYEEDSFSFSDINGSKQVNYTCNLPHKTNHIVAAYLRITRSDGSIDYAVMLEEDWLRLKDYSVKNNTRYNPQTRTYEGAANELYTANDGGIDAGFLCAKLIKHAFKTYPKMRIGKAELESQQPEEAQVDTDSFYINEPEQQQPVAPAPAAAPAAASFTNPAGFSVGVTIDPASSVEDDGTF